MTEPQFSKSTYTQRSSMKVDPDEILFDEAMALSDYLSRHGGRAVDDDAADRQPSKTTEIVDYIFEGHCELIDALAAVHKQEDRVAWIQLRKVYSSVSARMHQTTGISGKSIYDTLNPQGVRACIDRKHSPIIFGIIFFILALGFEVCKALTAFVGDSTKLDGLEALLFSSVVRLEPFLVPALWGAVGACTFLAKKISDRLATMTYEKNRAKGFATRIFLGSMLGLVADIVFFGTENMIGQEEVSQLRLGSIVVAFIVGLSVKPFYGALEALNENISAKLGRSK